MARSLLHAPHLSRLGILAPLTRSSSRRGRRRSRPRQVASTSGTWVLLNDFSQENCSGRYFISL